MTVAMDFRVRLDGEQAAFVGRAQGDLFLDTLDDGLDLGVVVEVELGDRFDQALEAHDVAAVELAVGLERGEHVGAGVVDEGVELALDVGQEAVDELVLLTAGLVDDVPVHLLQGTGALEGGGAVHGRRESAGRIAIGRNLQTLAVFSGQEVGDLALGQQRGQRDVGEGDLEAEAGGDLLDGRDVGQDASGEGLGERFAVAEVVVRHQGAQTLVGDEAGFTVGGAHVGADGLVVAHDLVTQGEVVVSTHIHLLPELTVGSDRDECAPGGLEAGIDQGLPGPALDGLQGAQRGGGEQELVAQVEQVGEILLQDGVGRQAQIFGVEAGATTPAADGDGGDDALFHELGPVGLAQGDALFAGELFDVVEVGLGGFGGCVVVEHGGVSFLVVIGDWGWTG